jgi:pyruvate kinase
MRGICVNPAQLAPGLLGTARMTNESFLQELRSLTDPVAALAASLREAETHTPELQGIDPHHLPSACNLVHYLALRRHDQRALQDRLAAVGLSSLGRAESCVAATLQNVLALLAPATGAQAPRRDPSLVTLADGQRRLVANTDALLGAAARARKSRIMVTLPSDAADDPTLVRELIRRGMDAARINCAHDDAAAWARMVTHVRRAASELGRSCRVLMDLAGPKLRTGALAAGPEVRRLRPARDALGRVVSPARAWLGDPGRAPAHVPTVLPVDAQWAAQLRIGATVKLDDARDKRRKLSVVDVTDAGAIVETVQTTYLTSGMRLTAGGSTASVAALPAIDMPLVLHPGDTLVLTRDATPGSLGPVPHIPCTLPSVFAYVRVGERIMFDDGAIAGRISHVTPDALTVTITDADAAGSKLRCDRGINLPDSTIELPPIDADDERDLAFVAEHADLVGFSFVRRPADVIALHERLDLLGRRDLGVILKIETRDAFERLPQLLLAAMRRPLVGVMIARGDLAVECGWERLAEVQEEILWICEAAHLPVVWATQVLDQLAKRGRPSRAEITDAAMGGRAECVMLNKGPHLGDAVETLDDILRRMEAHQTKKRPMLRPLALATRFDERR